MAEQMSHDVVNKSQSTSGSPLVDAAVNQTSIPSAGTGNDTILETTSHTNESTKATDHSASKRDDLELKSSSEINAASAAVEPSAGDAEATTAEIRATLADATTTLDEHAVQNTIANGMAEGSSHLDVSVDDGRTPEGSVDISLNSDTEGSRADVTEQKKDDKYHVRTGSVKKPATFSKVSVTKNFMAKTATAAPAAVKTGEKLAPASTASPTLSMAKPRLIAKTGTSLRDIQKARLGTELSSSPDPSKVWNKNRPTPPPPQKQFTDEELKQQYGIHLATRLQTDENDKESKWADIDDDEEDWVPEAVVWMDGTKSTLAPQEASPAQPKEQAASITEPAKVDGAKPATVVLKPTELGPQKTILKPGANAAAAQQAKQVGGPLGSTAEKALLKAKSPAPAPAKSPWATLPPVEKISPINPPVQQPHVHAPSQPRTFASQDARSYEPTGQPAPPAREIAADTFDRSWREGEGGTRELFNSANGRYEPVSEGRRGSVRPDRRPAVLQRPPQSPSESSQTRSTAQADGSWGRRRGSSISQGSVPPARRPSMSKPMDLPTPNEHGPTTMVGHDMRSSHAEQDNAAAPRFAQQTSWQQQMPARAEGEQQEQQPQQEQEDPVKVQERIMREKRELARKRRQEVEEREEIEKQERLKARLAQLEGAGKSRKERAAEAAAAVGPTSTASVASPSSTAAGPSVASEKLAEVNIASSEETSTHQTESSSKTPQLLHPKPSAPAIENPLAIQNLGLSEPALASAAAAAQPPAPEHHLVPSAARKSTAKDQPQPSAQPKQHLASPPDRLVPAPDQSQQSSVSLNLSHEGNSRASSHQQPSASFKGPVSSYSSPGDRKQQPFGRSPLQSGDSFSPWPTTAPSSNVWGTSGIGNGTFEGANAFAGLPNLGSLPPPPGMARPGTSTRISPQSLGQDVRSPNLHQQSGTDASRGFAPPGLDSLPDPFPTQSRVNLPSPAPGLGRQTHLPGPIAPPSRTQQQQQSQSTSQRPDPIAAWTNAAKNLPTQYKTEAEAAERKKDEPSVAEPAKGVIRETFRQTTANNGRLGAPRRYEKPEYTVHDAQGSRAVASHSPAASKAQPQQQQPPFMSSPNMHQDLWKAPGDARVRMPDTAFNAGPVQPPIGPPGSHRPPHAAPGNVGPHTAPIMPGASTAQDDNPPPPETSSHPVNDNSTGHPLVKLPPGSKPKVVVKLPPPALGPQLSPQPYGAVTMPPRPISNRSATGMAQPLVANATWQARFNGLFNRTPIQTETPPSPPKTPPKMQGPALVVASSSRTAMEEPRGVKRAAVSLPTTKSKKSPQGFTLDDSSAVVSKPSVDQLLLEERSFGSMPKVFVPRRAHESARQIATPSRVNLLHMGTNPRFDQGSVQAQSQSMFDMQDLHYRHRDGVYVHIPSRVARLARMLVRYPDRKNGYDPHRAGGPRKPSARYGGHNNFDHNNKGGRGAKHGSTAVTPAAKETAAALPKDSGPGGAAASNKDVIGGGSAAASPGTPTTTNARRTSHQHQNFRQGNRTQNRKATPVAPAS